PPLCGLLSGPGGDAGRVERLADHEQRRDEDDHRVAEPGQALAQRQDAGRPQDEGRADRDDLDREAAPDEEGDDPGDDGERDLGVIHLRFGSRAGRKTWPGYPGPNGTPRRNHTTNRMIQTIAMIRT